LLAPCNAFLNALLLEVVLVISGNDDIVYLQDHATQLRGQQQLLAFSDERINNEMLSHVCLMVNVCQRLEVLECVKDLPLLPVCIQSTPNLEFFSFTCLDLIAAKVSIGESPEFSANAIGIASSASAKARIAYCSSPGLLTAASSTASEQAISAAPPP
jgi:hypothetical protein